MKRIIITEQQYKRLLEQKMGNFLKKMVTPDTSEVGRWKQEVKQYKYDMGSTMTLSNLQYQNPNARIERLDIVPNKRLRDIVSDYTTNKNFSAYKKPNGEYAIFMIIE